MKCRKIVKLSRKVFWAYGLPVSSVATNVLILPLLALYWTAEHLSIWIVFMTLIGLVQMVEAALHPNIMRNCKFILNGDGKVFKEGYGVEKDYVSCNEISFHTSVSLLYRKYAQKLMLLIVPVGGAIVAWSTESANLFALLFAWVLMFFPIFLSMQISYGTAYVMANDDITTVNKITVMGRFIFCILTLFGLYFEANIQIVALIYSMCILSTKIYINLYSPLKYIHTSRANAENIRAVGSTLNHNTKKLVINNIFSFLIQRGSILLATFVLGASDAASFNLSVSVVVALSAVSQSWMSYNVPKLVQLRMKDKHAEIKDLMMNILKFSTLIYVLLCFFLILITKLSEIYIFDNFKLVSVPLMIFMMTVYGLELNHSIAAIFLTTANRVPFVRSTIITGTIALVLGLVFSKHIGVWGISIGLGLSQLAYNNWKWPYEMYKEFSSWKD